MQGNIEAVKQWPDGGISIKIGQTWYKTKNVEMLQMQGRTITFNPAPWTNPTSGKVTNWINDYVESGAAPGTADQAMAQAMTQQPPPIGSPQPPQSAPAPQTNKDCSIIAQALTKACTAPGDDVNKVWARYCSFYRFALKGVPDSTTPPQTPSYDGFEDQEIPF